MAPEMELKIKSQDNKIKYIVIRTARKKVTIDVVKTFGTIQDITDRKKIELAYKESKERFLNVFENNQTGVVVTDSQHKFTMVNSQFSNMVGYDKNELLSMTILDISSIDHREKAVKQFKELVSGETTSFVGQKTIQKKRWFSHSCDHQKLRKLR